MNRLLLALVALALLAGAASGQTFTHRYYGTPPTYSVEGQGVFALTDENGRQIVTSPTGASSTTVQGTAADDAAVVGDPVRIGCKYEATLNASEDGDASNVKCDADGRLLVAGSAADDAAAAGNPVPVGGMRNSTRPNYTNGDRTQLQADARGNIGVAICGFDLATCVVAAASSSDALSTSNAALFTLAETYWFNGASWDRAFTCPSTAVVNVTAGSTTELVALTASQVIRVCAVAISMSAAGTAKFVYGTGTNCGTGTTDITGAFPLATGTPLSFSASVGSVFRTATANALCLAAVTGNVVGVVTYAKF